MKVEDNQMRALSWKTRVSYGLGDTACNVVYGMIGSLLTIFYTDYVGISAAAIGVIMLISRIFDGCSDVIMGFVVNKTHSKYGQSRPWILWMAIPYAVSAVLLFTVPHTATNIQLIYIFVTYNFYSNSLLYSVESSIRKFICDDDKIFQRKRYVKYRSYGTFSDRKNHGSYIYNTTG